MPNSSTGIITCLVASATLFAACTGGERIGPDHGPSQTSDGQGGTSKAGSRLRPASFMNSDGSQASFGWYDTKLQKECSFDRIADRKGACIPADVLTISSETLTDRLSLSSPIFYVDSACHEGNGLILLEQECTEYGLVRITAPSETRSYPGCRDSRTHSYLVTKPFDPSKQKVYRYGVPPGGGRCCTCYEVKEPIEDATFVTFEPATDQNLGGLGVVVGDFTF